MGITGDAYQFVKVLHILAVVVGFGSVMLNGVYGLQARDKKGREGLAVAEAMHTVTTKVAMWFIYAVPVLGILALLLSDDTWKFSQAWISLSFVVYIAGLGLAHAVQIPNVNRMIALMKELADGAAVTAGAGGGPPPQAMELEKRGKQAAMVGGVLNLLVVVAIYLMVFKPGL